MTISLAPHEQKCSGADHAIASCGYTGSHPGVGAMLAGMFSVSSAISAGQNHSAAASLGSPVTGQGLDNLLGAVFGR